MGLFIFLVNEHNKLNDRILLIKNKMQINKDELLFLEYSFQDRDAGDKYCQLDPFLANDFDLFGNGSLYQYINRCMTNQGKECLAKKLCFPDKNADVINVKQAAVKELSHKMDFVQNFQAYGKLIPENGREIETLQTWMNQPQCAIRNIRIISFVLAFINIVWISFAALNLFTWASLFIPLSVSLLIVGKETKRITKSHSQLKDISDIVIKYTELFRLVESENFKTDYLKHIQLQLLHEKIKASHAFNSLFKILAIFDIRDNVMLSFVLNAVLIWDIHTYYALLQWKAHYKENVDAWFSSLAEVETLISLAIFAFNNDQFAVYPVVSNDIFMIEAEEIGHPLLPQEIRVNNTFRITNMPSVLIITGANMAGKSTFLRTVAVNLLLSMNGAPVIARKFIFSPCDIMSSIKIQDSLTRNESYFYAELLRLKEIIEHVKSNSFTLVILDEILRGTNTKDKQIGSIGLLENLIDYNAMVVMATHDLTIGELENKYPEIVTNCCFGLN
jgi:DNA mismatch repair ATPase MutS